MNRMVEVFNKDNDSILGATIGVEAAGSLMSMKKQNNAIKLRATTVPRMVLTFRAIFALTNLLVLVYFNFKRRIKLNFR